MALLCLDAFSSWTHFPIEYHLLQFEAGQQHRLEGNGTYHLICIDLPRKCLDLFRRGKNRAHSCFSGIIRFVVLFTGHKISPQETFNLFSNSADFSIEWIGIYPTDDSEIRRIGDYYGATDIVVDSFEWILNES